MPFGLLLCSEETFSALLEGPRTDEEKVAAYAEEQVLTGLRLQVVVEEPLFS